MSPEQFAAEDVDARSDIFSAGLVLYESLSGKRAYSAVHPPTLMQLVMTGDVKPLQELAPDIDPALCAIVERALSVEHANRYASAQEMSAALDAWVGGEGESAIKLASTPGRAKSTAPGRPIPSTQRRALGAMAALSFVTGAVIVYFGAPHKAPLKTEDPPLTPSVTATLDASIAADASAATPTLTALDQASAAPANSVSDPPSATAAPRPAGNVRSPAARPSASVAITSQPPKKGAPRVGDPCDFQRDPPFQSNLICSIKTKQWFCPKEMAACDGDTTCRRLDDDRNNCGACGVRVLPDEICRDGKRVVCPSTTYRCDSQCLIAGTFDNCSSCTDRCHNDEDCINRRCEKRR